MNTDIVEGKWEQFKGEVQKTWGKLTNDHIDQINGDRQKLLGALQETYGYAKERAEEEVDRFEKSCGCGSNACSRDGKVA